MRSQSVVTSSTAQRRQSRRLSTRLQREKSARNPSRPGPAIDAASREKSARNPKAPRRRRRGDALARTARHTPFARQGRTLDAATMKAQMQAARLAGEPTSQHRLNHAAAVRYAASAAAQVGRCGGLSSHAQRPEKPVLQQRGAEPRRRRRAAMPGQPLEGGRSTRQRKTQAQAA